ncbi:MAG: FKBP12-associated protein [Pycnora praestabilis]|nr:MAG: FKBP12-associated protein [Pycnora praestabilis]
MKCNASRSSEGNNKKTLKCDEECARLERNRKLALALNIDPATHKDDHIPYSQDTLSMFKESTKWSQTQEREFRVFAMDDVEKRLRFKPMPPHQRAFLHALAEDYGLDSESMDPEPHRHVALFKSPRFVTAPNKTLQECVRIKHAAESSSLPTATETQTLRSSNFAKSSFNGYILAGTRFGLTLEDLHSSITSVLTSAAGIQFDISFLPSEEVVCKARNANLFMPLSDKDILNVLKNLQPTLAKIVSAKSLASTIQLCRLDDSLNVLHREMDGLSDTGGWSQVAAKAAVPMRVPRQMAVGGKSVYTVLGSRLAEAKKKKEEDEKRRRESVVDDWEEAELREEEKELGTAGTDADESHGIVEEHKVVVEMASGMNKEGLNASADSLIEQHGKPATVVVETDPAQEEAEETTSVMRHVQTLVAGSAEGNNNVVDTIPRLEFVPSPAEDPLHGNFTL